MQKFNIVHARLSLMHVVILILIICQFVATYPILIIFAEYTKDIQSGSKLSQNRAKQMFSTKNFMAPTVGTELLTLLL